MKVGITPASVEYSTFEDIWTHESAGGVTFIFSSSLNTTRVITFTPTESGTYTFKTGYEDETRVDTYLYVVDPYTTNSCLYNDDDAGDLQALITMDLVAGRTYFMVVSTYNITSTTGRLSVSVIAIIGDINNERIITATIEATNIFELILCFVVVIIISFFSI